MFERAAAKKMLNLDAIEASMRLGRPGTPTLRELIAEWRPAAPVVATGQLKSPLEAMVLPLIVGRGLPAPRSNAPVTLIGGKTIEVDFLWAEQRFVLEADSRDFHGTDVAFERDRWRDRELLRARYSWLRATRLQAETEAEALQTQLAEAQALTEARTGELAQAGERLAAQERQSQQAVLEHAAELARLTKLLEDERQDHEDAVELQRGELLEQAGKATHVRETLTKELATAKADAEAARHALSQQKASDQKRLDAAEMERAKASEAASAAREQAARLGGQAETLQAQVTELMRVIATRLAVQDAKDGTVAGTVQAETTRTIPDSGSPVLQS